MKKFLIIIAFGILSILGAPETRGQEIEATIKIVSVAPSGARLRVEGKVLKPKFFSTLESWSFLQSYADATELGSRVENLKLFGEGGEPLEIKKLIDGEFQTGKPAYSFEYEIKADAPSRLTSTAHVSWLNSENGLLMLNDLLPQWNSTGTAAAQPVVSASITIKTPSGWKITGAETRSAAETFAVNDVERAIFLVGKNWRETSLRVDKTELNFALVGEWQFSDDEALEMASSILAEHQKIFGDIPVSRTQVFLLPFPQKNAQSNRWQAETRGASVTILSGAISFKSQALQRLHEQLRHELFHLWLPNAVALRGNYDWFYEGFAVYQALRTGVELNQIRFEDYLNTLAQAYDMAEQRTAASLIEISTRRWTGATAASGGSVYARGMVVAFLCDAALLRAGRGKRSLGGIFREIYRKHRAGVSQSLPAQQANPAILAILKGYPELLPVVKNHIEGATTKIEWQNELSAFGIEIVSDSPTALKVTEKPSGRQKDLLDKLGYNQWRKLLQKKK